MISKFILKLIGWKNIVSYPLHNLDKYLVIVIPHTSNWDFPLGLLSRAAINEDIKYLGKDSLFRFPFGFLFRWLGGYPVVRSKSTNYVETVVNLFNSKKRFAVCIAPEGTRKKVDKLKSGFYYMAHGANIPLILCSFDWKKKEIKYSEPFYTSGNYESDLPKIMKYFDGVEGKNPDDGINFNIQD